MSFTAIIQARMGSSRLPGKMMMPLIESKTSIEVMLERIRPSRHIQQVVIATTNNKEDDPLEELAESLNMSCFRGNALDVLDRYYQAALHHQAQEIIRLTGDCPLHDYRIIDDVCTLYLRSQVDYCSNVNPPSFPDGLDVEVFSFNALKKAWSKSSDEVDREHVTPYLRAPENKFLTSNYASEVNNADLRITLDEPKDLELIRIVFDKFAPHLNFSSHELIDFLRANEKLTEINSKFQRSLDL
ncbi:MAG: glycosyltransferase family protein [Planctomycetes bacterium]|nr:glycosyltransferase family protein [Planctomycetota bacterium]